jgi:hypothetical protein
MAKAKKSAKKRPSGSGVIVEIYKYDSGKTTAKRAFGKQIETVSMSKAKETISYHMLSRIEKEELATVTIYTYA